MKIQTVAVMGAGAVGAYFIWGLKEKLGEHLWVVADGERKNRLEEEGLLINGARIKPCVKTPEEAEGADLLLVAVKYGALKESLDSIQKIVGEHTIVMSLLNGVDSEEIIGKRIGMEHIVYSLMKIASQRKDNHIVFDPAVTQGIFFGEAGKGQKEERVKAVAELFDGTEIHYQICENIIRDIWLKFMLNVSKNLPQAMIGCGFGAYESSPNVAALSEKLKGEVAAIAKAKGIDLSDESGEAGKSGMILPSARFSTLQDLDAKRHTEIDMFAGAMMQMGKETGVPTPYSEFAYYVIKALEEKNDGLLD